MTSAEFRDLNSFTFGLTRYADGCVARDTQEAFFSMNCFSIANLLSSSSSSSLPPLTAPNRIKDQMKEYFLPSLVENCFFLYLFRPVHMEKEGKKVTYVFIIFWNPREASCDEGSFAVNEGVLSISNVLWIIIRFYCRNISPYNVFKFQREVLVCDGKTTNLQQ